MLRNFALSKVNKSRTHVGWENCVCFYTLEKRDDPGDQFVGTAFHYLDISYFSKVEKRMLNNKLSWFADEISAMEL